MTRSFLTLLATFLLGGLLASAAFAQDKPVDAAAPADAAITPADDGAKGEIEFPWFSLVPKVGFAYYGAGDITLNGITSTVPSRSGARIALGLALGGDGFGFDIEPFFTHESGTGWTSNTVGAYFGLAYRLQFGRFFPHIGLGLQSGYLMDDGIDLGLELHGRVPIGVTWYLLDDLGLVAELGIGYGATAIKFKLPPAAPGVTVDDAIKFAPALSMDFTVGIRWP